MSAVPRRTALVAAGALAASLAAPAHSRAGDRAVTWPGAVEVDGPALAVRPEPERADAIARFVAHHGAAGAARWLHPLLAAGPPQVRLYVARLLIRAGDAPARAAALGWLTGPSSTPSERALGLEALSWEPAGPASAALRATFEQGARDRDALMRAAALDGLARLDGADAGHLSPSLPVFLASLDDLDREVRLRAVRLVVRAAEVDPAATALAAPMLIDRLDDSDRQVRVTALRALGLLRDTRTVATLLRIAQADPPDLQTPAIDALGWPGAGAAVPFLTGLLRRRPADEAARHAATALGQIASPAALAALVGALRTPPLGDEVSAALVAAGAAAVEPLLREAAGVDLGSAGRAITLLGRIRDHRAVARLAPAARRRGGTGPLALVAVDALGRIGDPDAVPALAEVAEAPEPEVRRAALDALRAIGDARAADVVDHGLADPDAGVRAAAAALAGRIHAAGAAITVADRLADPSALVRTASARALAELAADVAAARPALLERALAAVASPRARDRAEQEALADALESLSTDSAADARRLETAFLGGGQTRLLGGALAAAHARQPLENRAVIQRLLGDLIADPDAAGAAAEALGLARLDADDATPLGRAAAQGEPADQASLCEAIAGLPDGGAWLADWIQPGHPPEVRAAAAWAARRRPELAGALRAQLDDDGPVAVNARAALQSVARAAVGWAGLRMVDDDGTPLAGRWVDLRSGALVVAVRTDPRGRARVSGLPAVAIAVTARP